MLAIHYCSDRDQTIEIYKDLLAEVQSRIAANQGVLPPDAARIFWVNPVADLRAMNLLEDCGGRLCGTEFLFCHALDEIPENLPPMEALAQMALADPMVGPARDRADRICREAAELSAEAVVISRIPGASHCALEGSAIRETISARLGIPAIEIEVPPISDAVAAALRNRLEALVETVHQRRAR
jgi:benzoyl-CoA reductase/2-hydroxyglutaryl-CoA dehydratase subunit BcrC/BadD/HgdB